MKWMLAVFSQLCIAAVIGQTRNQNWLLRYDTWLKFDTDPPASLLGADCPEGVSACISDAAGNLLFYVGSGSSDTIRDASHGVLANSATMDYLIGGSKALVLPKPGAPDRYVIACIGNSNFQAGLLEVDMDLNGGLGALLDSVPDFFMTNVTSKLTGVAHANGLDYWIVLHEWMTDAFHAYQLSAAGLDTVPVISSVGAVHWQAGGNLPRWGGPMVASVDGTRIALAAYDNSNIPLDCIVQLFHFNPATGEVSFWADLPGFSKADGVEFSPNGDRLYVADQIDGVPLETIRLWQYDLSDPDSLTIMGSAVLLSELDQLVSYASPSKTLLLTPSGKIYHRHATNSTWLGVVDEPDALGMASNYDAQGFLGNAMGQSAILPNFCKQYHDSGYGVGIDETHMIGMMSVSPNPLINEGVLRMASGSGVEGIQWSDALGRIVRSEPVSFFGDDIILGRGGLPSGSYTLSLFMEGEVVGRANVVLQ